MKAKEQKKKLFIVYGNRKEEESVYDASTPELRAEAFLKLFKHLDRDWKVYSAGWPEDATGALQKNLYKQAKAGDAEAAECLLILRQEYEYETWRFAEVEPETTPEGFQKMVARREDPRYVVKSIDPRGIGSDHSEINVNMQDGTKLTFALIPTIAWHGDWSALLSAAREITTTLAAKWGEDGYAPDRDRVLDEAMTRLNEMRMACAAVLFPETFSWPFDVPKFIKRKMDEATTFLQTNATNGTEVEELPWKTIKRDANFNREQAISELVGELRSAVRMLNHLYRGTYKLEDIPHHMRGYNDVLMKYKSEVSSKEK